MIIKKCLNKFIKIPVILLTGGILVSGNNSFKFHEASADQAQEIRSLTDLCERLLGIIRLTQDNQENQRSENIFLNDDIAELRRQNVNLQNEINNINGRFSGGPLYQSVVPRRPGPGGAVANPPGGAPGPNPVANPPGGAPGPNPVANPPGGAPAPNPVANPPGGAPGPNPVANPPQPPMRARRNSAPNPVANPPQPPMRARRNSAPNPNNIVPRRRNNAAVNAQPRNNNVVAQAPKKDASVQATLDPKKGDIKTLPSIKSNGKGVPKTFDSSSNLLGFAIGSGIAGITSLMSNLKRKRK